MAELNRSLPPNLSHQGDKATFNKHIPIIFLNNIRKTVSTEFHLSNVIQLTFFIYINNINQRGKPWPNLHTLKCLLEPHPLNLSFHPNSSGFLPKLS